MFKRWRTAVLHWFNLRKKEVRRVKAVMVPILFRESVKKRLKSTITSNKRSFWVSNKSKRGKIMMVQVE
jgi:hypothetical protein